VSHLSEIVGKEELVVCYTIRHRIDWSTQITVDEFRGLPGSCCRLMRWLPMLLSFQACFAYSHCRPGLYSHSVNHSCQFSDIVLAEVAHALVLDVKIEFGC